MSAPARRGSGRPGGSPPGHPRCIPHPRPPAPRGPDSPSLLEAAARCWPGAGDHLLAGEGGPWRHSGPRSPRLYVKGGCSDEMSSWPPPSPAVLRAHGWVPLLFLENHGLPSAWGGTCCGPLRLCELHMWVPWGWAALGCISGSCASGILWATDESEPVTPKILGRQPEAPGSCGPTF